MNAVGSSSTIYEAPIIIDEYDKVETANEKIERLEREVDLLKQANRERSAVINQRDAEISRMSYMIIEIKQQRHHDQENYTASVTALNNRYHLLEQRTQMSVGATIIMSIGGVALLAIGALVAVIAVTRRG